MSSMLYHRHWPLSRTYWNHLLAMCFFFGFVSALPWNSAWTSRRSVGMQYYAAKCLMHLQRNVKWNSTQGSVLNLCTFGDKIRADEGAGSRFFLYCKQRNRVYTIEQKHHNTNNIMCIFPSSSSSAQHSLSRCRKIGRMLSHSYIGKKLSREREWMVRVCVWVRRSQQASKQAHREKCEAKFGVCAER